MIVHPADALLDAIERAGSPACVGLDPVLERLPPSVRARHHEALEAIAEFSHAVVRAAAGVVPAIKPQAACFERYGSRGVALLESLVAEASRLGLFVVLDAKRGDIASTAEHYAAGATRTGALAITVNGYLGASAIQAFLDRGLLAFVLVRTSNPDSDPIQGATLRDGRTVAQAMAELVARLGTRGTRGMSSAGAVVGATKADDAQALRRIMPDAIFLVPGYGAQGGTKDDLRRMVRSPGASACGLLVNSSRAVIYPEDSGDDWRGAIARAAVRFRDEIGDAVGAR